ncbi:MAG: Lrp/AsnC family transcriptional regulator [Chloroflexota bacterium]|nr:Lrp/AsnC family transcriptional regulator [Chloroflexota bacterium]
MGIIRGNRVDRPPDYTPEEGGRRGRSDGGIDAPGAPTLEYDARLSQEKLAQMAGTTVDEVAAIVERCEREGVIRR